MGIIKTEGVVLREISVGEADKIITIFSKDKGKIQASVKGGRKPKNFLSASTQLFCYCTFNLFEGKSMHFVSQADIIESFYKVRESLESLYCGTYLLELTTKVVMDEYPNRELFKLLLNTLFMLSKSKKDPLFIKIVFEFRLLSILGIQPNIINCTLCGESKDYFYFDCYNGGLICKECINKENRALKSFPISFGAIAALRYIFLSDYKKVFSFEISEEVFKELSKISKDFIRTHLDLEFKTLNILENIYK